MRIFLHDFAGHPFQIQLSRHLAARGHDVLHGYCASLPTTPQASLGAQEGDPRTLQIRGIRLDRPIRKDKFVERWRLERQYGHLLGAEVRSFRPEVVIAANTPLDALARLQRATSDLDARFVYWVQDLIGIASERLLREKVPVVGAAVGRFYARLEQRLLRRSDGLVLITEDFLEAIPAASRERAHVIPNWAPLAEVPVRPRDNAWARQHLPESGLRFLYAGTLGMKHNPDLLLQVALRFPDRAQVVVVSEGAGAEWLRDRKAERNVQNLILLPFQPFDQMAEVHGAADVLVAVLEPDAGVFSVPSKVLTYLCAARPLLLGMPPENLAARIVSGNRAGLVSPPGDVEGFIAAAAGLIDDPRERAEMGRRGRAYAEEHFDIDAVADRFEDVLRSVW